MLSILGTQMMGAPQGVKAADGAHVLPWPNGSVVQAKLVPGESPGTAMLLLGGYRLRAEVPPNTQMGEVWLQVMGQQMPAQFHLLTQFQAHRLLTEMLRQRMQLIADEDEGEGKPKASRQGGEKAASSGGSWPRLDGSSGLPFATLAGGDPNRLLLQQDDGDGARGVVQRQGDGEQFLLHGRLDLEALGSVAFALEGGAEQPWRLRLFARDTAVADAIHPEFSEWVAQQRELLLGEAVAQFEGQLEAGLPIDRVAPREFIA
ncbi:MAG: hypothetical protein Q9M26_05600 [Mariprofundales bacterium]|nr:hypothetical protein [Mariprofundales bacterium]